MASVFKRKGKGNYIIRWSDVDGRRPEKSSRTTDKRAADRIAAKYQSDAALRRTGVIDPEMDRFAREDAKSLQDHIDAYIIHMGHGRRSPRTLADARVHLKWVVGRSEAARLSDLSLDAVEAALRLLHEKGRSARTINHRGGSVRAFLQWCVKTNRIRTNPLRHLAHLNEASDRRRIRRALTEEETGRLLAVARPRGRLLWYLLALYAGLRLADLKRLRWGHVDLQRKVITIDQGKAKRVDELPMHECLQVELRRQRPPRALPTDAVFPTTPTNQTRRNDFHRAQIEEVDRDGRHADLHALRVTLGTRLAREGIAPQLAKQIMRHSRYSTTLSFYTDIGLADTAKAIESLPMPEAVEHDPHHKPHQLEHEGAPCRAT